jgi:hypothetical protein
MDLCVGGFPHVRLIKMKKEKILSFFSLFLGFFGKINYTGELHGKLLSHIFLTSWHSVADEAQLFLLDFGLLVLMAVYFFILLVGFFCLEP